MIPSQWLTLLAACIGLAMLMIDTLPAPSWADSSSREIDHRLFL